MRHRLILVCLGIWMVNLCFWPQIALAQREGFLRPSESTFEEMLPPEAVYEGGYVLHKIHSTQENLHLLAGYYYGNTREWKRIYEDNRKIIKNPNRLPVGEKIRINVGENWRPRFSYEQWFGLATRNGEWKSGESWQRATIAPVPSQPAESGEQPPASEQPKIIPTPKPTSPAAESKPEEPVAEEPVEEEPAEEEPAEEEDAPAEPAY
jgi:hypothetical protein